jgi:putative FmdB family regulatory protein
MPRNQGQAVACILLFLGENCDRRRFQCSMPTYEYSCEKCGGAFEIVQSMRDEALRECPKELCRQKKWGHGKVKRLIGTGAGLIFKGSGFYITDYRSDSYREAAKKDAPAAPATAGEKTAGSKEPKTPATPAKASEGKPKKQAAE